MYQFVETIQIKDGIPALIDLHQQRINGTFLFFDRFEKKECAIYPLLVQVNQRRYAIFYLYGFNKLVHIFY